MIILSLIIRNVFQIYWFMLIIYILMSWVPSARESTIGQILEKACEPYLGLFRRLIPPFGMIDFSPIIALIALNFIQLGLLKILSYLPF